MRARLLVPALALSLLAPTALAAGPAVGSKCTKVGATSAKGSVKLVCSKKGRLLVWTQVVPNKTPVALPSTPSSTPTPTSTPTPVSLTLEQQWDQTGSNALKVYRKWGRISDGVTPSASVDFSFGPNLWPSAAAEMRRRMNNVVAFFDPYIKPHIPIYFIGGGFTDVEWACNRVSKWPNQTVQSCIDDSKAQQRRNFHDSWGGQVPIGSQHWYLIQTAETVDARAFWPRIEHEYIHTIQQNQIGDFGPKVVCWYHGMPEYLGILSAAQGNLKYFLDSRNSAIVGAPVKRSINMTAKDYADWLMSGTKPSISNSRRNCEQEDQEGDYHDAVLAAEWMVDQLGIPGVLQFQAELANLNFEAAMRKTFNKDLSAIYAEMGEYMLRETTIVRANSFARLDNCRGELPGPERLPTGCRF